MALPATPRSLHVRGIPTLDTVDIDRFFQILHGQNPNPKASLVFQDSFTLLVAVVLSAQTTDQAVNQVTRSLFAAANTPQKMIDLGTDGVATHIQKLGLWRQKARYLIALSQKIIEEYEGGVPTDRQSLESLPGVGPKTAGVVLNVGYGHETFPVDTHVFRVCNRTGLAPGKTPRAVEKILKDHIPKRWRKTAHHWLVLHGRHTCKAQRPLCSACLVKMLCCFYQTGQQNNEKGLEKIDKTSILGE